MIITDYKCTMRFNRWINGRRDLRGPDKPKVYDIPSDGFCRLCQKQKVDELSGELELCKKCLREINRLAKVK